MQHPVQGLQSVGSVLSRYTAQFGKARYAHPVAQAGDSHLVAPIDDATARRIERLANRGADGIAMHGGQRQPDAQRAEQARRIRPSADHGGVIGACAGFAGDSELDAAGAADVRDLGVEFKFDATALRLVFEQQGKLAAVDDFSIDELNGTKKWRVRTQGGFQFADVECAQFLEIPARFTQQLQTRLYYFAVLLGAQQHQETLTAFVVQF